MVRYHIKQTMENIPAKSELDYVMQLIPPEVIQTTKEETMMRVNKLKFRDKQYWNQGEFGLFMACLIVMQVHP